MTIVRLLDTGALGLITHPKASPQSDACNRWLRHQLDQTHTVLVPGICDYELRRKLIQIGSLKSIEKLDALRNTIGFAEITTEVMDQAADFWAQARQIGKATADDKALDGDMILSAHAAVLARGGDEVIVATTNVKHLNLFCDARLWSDIV